MIYVNKNIYINTLRKQHMRYNVSKHAKEGGDINHKKMLERIKNHNQFCKQCKNKIPYDKRRNTFCSHSCAIMDNHPTYNKGKICYCKKCNNRINSNKIFCNKKCEGIFKWNSIKQKIERGEVSDMKILRKYMLEKYECKCWICKRKTWMDKPIPVEIDHIDGNSENNLPVNLRILCRNCHGQTNTYGSKNRGFGRDSLKKIREYGTTEEQVLAEN